MKNSFYNAKDSFGFMTFTASRVLSATLRRELKRAGLHVTPEQWGVLVVLWEKKNASQEELAQIACVDKSTMSRILSLMEDKELITRRIDPANERKKIICATEQAFSIRERGYAVANQTLQEALEGVSSDDAQTCMQVLDAIKRNLEGRHGV